jgi:pimeloyl-ACP methyl ester carboxylesterase
MTITTEHVRQLSTLVPRMVGDTMTYLDNERPSDVLIICLHGIGDDQRGFEDILRQTPYRAVSLSLYGFSPVARLRPALPYVDHNLLAGFLIEEIHQNIAHQTLVIVGHSSGSDQCLNILASSVGERLQPDGLVLLGPSVVPAKGRMSSHFSSLTGDPAENFNTLRSMSSFAENLTEWLIMHHYLLRAFGKFKTDTEALREFAQTYIETLEDDRFFRLFQTAVDRTRHLRCIFGYDDTPDSDRALELHISDNALGDGFSEEMIANVQVGHIDLKKPSVVLPLVEEIVRRN